MGRDFNSYYTAQNPVGFGVNRPISNATETYHGYNQNYLLAKKLVPLVTHVWPDWIHSHTAADGSTYWTLGSWRRKVIKDHVTVTCAVRVKNTNDTNSGRLRFQLASNSNSGTITVAANATEYTASVDLTIDPSQTTDTIEVAVLDPQGGNDGKISIQSVTIYTKPLTSPLAAGETVSGFVPIDTAETQAEAPLSTYLRNTKFENLDTIYKTKVPGTVVTFSANYDERDNNEWILRTTSTSYVEVVTIPCPVPLGVTKLGIAVQGWGGAGAKCKITSQAGGEKEVEIDGSWTYGGANTAQWETHLNAVTVNSGASNEAITISIKTTSGTVYLAGLCVWMEDVT